MKWSDGKDRLDSERRDSLQRAISEYFAINNHRVAADLTRENRTLRLALETKKPVRAAIA